MECLLCTARTYRCENISASHSNANSKAKKKLRSLQKEVEISFFNKKNCWRDEKIFRSSSSNCIAEVGGKKSVLYLFNNAEGISPTFQTKLWMRLDGAYKRKVFCLHKIVWHSLHSKLAPSSLLFPFSNRPKRCSKVYELLARNINRIFQFKLHRVMYTDCRRAWTEQRPTTLWVFSFEFSACTTQFRLRRFFYVLAKSFQY